MPHKTLAFLALTAASLSLLSGCGGHQGIRVTEGTQQIGSAPTGSLFTTNQATIVHVNEFDRLATLRNASKFEAGTFLVVRDREGRETAKLRTRANRAIGLRTADILEGHPKINNLAKPASATEKARLEKLYRDFTAE